MVGMRKLDSVCESDIASGIASAITSCVSRSKETAFRAGGVAQRACDVT